MPVTFVINPRPDKRDIKRVEVPNSAGDWKRIYQRTWPFVQSIEIRNLSKASTLYIFDGGKKPSGTQYDEIRPQGSVTEDYDPAHIFANTSAGTIDVLIIVKYFSVEYMSRMKIGIYEPMSPSAKFKEKLYNYFYGTDKVFGKVKSPGEEEE